jgi:hypothetical protein
MKKYFLAILLPLSFLVGILTASLEIKCSIPNTTTDEVAQVIMLHGIPIEKCFSETDVNYKAFQR